MNNVVHYDENKNKVWDWILVIGIILSPMTGLRVWKIGPAEVLCLLWSLRFFPNKMLQKNNEYFRFFAGFLLCMFIGTIWGLMVSPEEVLISHWPTWIYLAFISIALYTGLRGYSPEYTERLLYRVCCGASVWYLFLYLYSIYVKNVFFGAPLWFHATRFTGGGTNPHQVAVLMCGAGFCLLRKALMNEKPIQNYLLAATAIYLELQTASSTGVAALVIGVIILIYVSTIHNVHSAERKFEVSLIEFGLVIILLMISFTDIYNYIMNWIISDPNGQGRIVLFSKIGTTISKSPFFGLGPGVHAQSSAGAYMEYHNTYTEIIAATGLVGLVLFIRFSLITMRNLLYDDLYMPSVVAIYIYGLGGFAMRRLAYWGIFTFIYVLAEQRRDMIRGHFIRT